MITYKYSHILPFFLLLSNHCLLQSLQSFSSWDAFLSLKAPKWSYARKQPVPQICIYDSVTSPPLRPIIILLAVAIAIAHRIEQARMLSDIFSPGDYYQSRIRSSSCQFLREYCRVQRSCYFLSSLEVTRSQL